MHRRRSRKGSGIIAVILSLCILFPTGNVMSYAASEQNEEGNIAEEILNFSGGPEDFGEYAESIPREREASETGQSLPEAETEKESEEKTEETETGKAEEETTAAPIPSEPEKEGIKEKKQPVSITLSCENEIFAGESIDLSEIAEINPPADAEGNPYTKKITVRDADGFLQETQNNIWTSPAEGVYTLDAEVLKTTEGAEESCGQTRKTVTVKKAPVEAEKNPEFEISTDLPKTSFINIRVDLMKNVSVTPSDYEGHKVNVRVSSVKLQNGKDFIWDGNTVFTPDKVGYYDIEYESYITEGEGERVLSVRTVVLPVMGDRPVGEFLDGDYAYISEAGMLEDSRTASGFSVRTGTAPWDENDERGNDSNDLNNTLRSFDVATYTLFFKSKVRDDSPCSAYREGRLFFEFILPGDRTQAQFEIESMGWLKAKKDVHFSVEEGIYNSSPAQILRGSYIWEPSTNNPTAIGESYQELSVAVRVLSMTEGERVNPYFTFWLEHNNVPSVADENNVPTGELALNYKGLCPEHNDIEPKSFSGPEVIITSIPRLNVKFKPGYFTHNQVLGEFDFNTGDTDTYNYGAGVRDGRLVAFGAVLQVQGKGANYGLRGCQFPDGSPITFDVSIENTFKGDSGSYHSTEGFEPMLWSVNENNGLQRSMNGRKFNGIAYSDCMTLPYNRRDLPSKSCYDGGNWNGVLSDDGKTIHMTVSDYKFDLNNAMPFPYQNRDNSEKSYIYYNPEKILNYWDISEACFSAGKIHMVQPFYNENGEYIVNKFNDPGTFQVYLNDTNLMASFGDEGEKIYLPRVNDNSNQMNKADDRANFTCYINLPGYIHNEIYYNKYENPLWFDGLTNGCKGNGKDWLLSGTGLSVEFRVSTDSLEGQNRVVAVDHLIKFDDRFFEFEKSYRKVLYGAKPDGTGWDHKGLKPSEAGYDDEMMRATADDLIFYPTLEALEADGKTLIAVLFESRFAHIHMQYIASNLIFGHCKNDPELADNVFMVTHSARVWNRADVKEYAKQYLGKESLTTEDYQRYVNEAFPSRADRPGELMSYDEYITPFWIHEYDNSSGLRTYKKSVYDESGYVDGSSGTLYGDSCRVIGYTSQVEKKVAQVVTDTNTEKRAFDLDVNQRVADYVIYGHIHRTKMPSETDTKMTETVHFRDYLPPGLTYIPGSSYYGGTYIQTGEGKQGKIEGGIHLPEPVISYEKNGMTVLEWVINDVEVTNEEITHMKPLYYSTDIGTPGNEETDVKNNQQLLNTVIIWCEGETKHPFTYEAGNKADFSIIVSKNKAISISKIAEQAVVEPGEEMGFVMNVGNNGEGRMEVIAVDSLPYAGDRVGSDFRGPCQVTELSVIASDDKILDIILNDNFKFYYTEDEKHRGKGSPDFVKEDFNDGSWHMLTVDSKGVFTIPKKDFAPVAIAGLGGLPGGRTLKMHITLLLPEGRPGDYIANRLTNADMESYARSFIVSRTLQGLVWSDRNANGLQAHSEELFGSSISAGLMKLRTGGNPMNPGDYEIFYVNGRPAEIKLGQEMNVIDGTVSAYIPGNYRFTDLPQGVFAVVFTGSDLEKYTVSPVNQGEDDSIDSDAEGYYGDDGGLYKACILNILMPHKSEIKSLIFSSVDNDLGLYKAAALRFFKVKAENMEKPLPGTEFRLYMRMPGCTDEPVNPASPGLWKLIATVTSGADGLVSFEGLIPGEYRLVETKAAPGRLLPEGQWKFTVSDGRIISPPSAAGDVLPPAFAESDGVLLLPNMKPMDVPSAGGKGTFSLGLLAVLMICGGALLVKAADTKHKNDNKVFRP